MPNYIYRQVGKVMWFIRKNYPGHVWSIGTEQSSALPVRAAAGACALMCAMRPRDVNVSANNAKPPNTM